MSEFKSTYKAKPVDERGMVAYTVEENEVWATLYKRQLPIVETYACTEYLDGLKLLNLPKNRVAQIPEISSVLHKATGWVVEPVEALIPVDKFFSLLANKKFPAATFIRKRKELDYLKEPDIFHETFGHCPLLTNQGYADFTETYGKLALQASAQDREMLARLYWFTIEFGLINTEAGIRAYGGGILSSIKETVYCIESPIPKRVPFNAIEALRTPFRIDILQPIYFVIDNFDTLFQLANDDLMTLINNARKLGTHKPLFKELAK